MTEVICSCGNLLDLTYGEYPIKFRGGDIWFKDVPQYNCGECEVVLVKNSVIDSCKQQLFLSSLIGSAHDE
jgi:hypothetical protein